MEEKVINYEKGDLTVYWKPKSCIHSEKCWRGLGEVFKPKERPWIQVDGADAERIKAQIDQCPSGALSYSKESATSEKTSEQLKAILVKDGPILVQGSMLIQDESGVVTEKKNAALCRCGASTNKPFCDGTHKKVGFTS